jgi:hypothetical protein
MRKINKKNTNMSNSTQLDKGNSHHTTNTDTFHKIRILRTITIKINKVVCDY